MNWIYWALLSVLILSISALFQRLAMKKKESNPMASAILFQIMLTIGSAFALLFTGFHMPDFSKWPFFLASGFLYAFGSYCIFRASKAIEASELSILGGFGMIASIAASYIVLGERLSIVQWTGVVGILSAILLVNYAHIHVRFHSGILYALLGNALYGTAVVFDGFILQTYDSFSFLPIISMLPALILIVTFPRSAYTAFVSVPRIDRNLLVYGFLYISAAELFYFAMDTGAHISQLTTIMRSSIIITVILSMFILKERSHPWYKLLGAILTVIGLYFIR